MYAYSSVTALQGVGGVLLGHGQTYHAAVIR